MAGTYESSNTNVKDAGIETVNEIIVRDFPESGYFIEDEYVYDLAAFDQFYTDFGEKFETDKIRGKYGVIKLSEYENVKFDGKPNTTFYAEASSLLSVIPDYRSGKKLVTVMKNLDVSKVGNSGYINSVYPNLHGFKSLYPSQSTIHTHFRPGMITFKTSSISNDVINILRGLSEADYIGAKFDARNVVVDDKYIYLNNGNPKQTIIFKRK